jgi:endonuclease YncB( thermonuclease family)
MTSRLRPYSVSTLLLVLLLVALFVDGVEGRGRRSRNRRERREDRQRLDLRAPPVTEEEQKAIDAIMGATCSSLAGCMRVETPGQVHQQPQKQPPQTQNSAASGFTDLNKPARRPSAVNPHPQAPASYAAVVAGGVPYQQAHQPQQQQQVHITPQGPGALYPLIPGPHQQPTAGTHLPPATAAGLPAGALSSATATTTVVTHHPKQPYSPAILPSSWARLECTVEKTADGDTVTLRDCRIAPLPSGPRGGIDPNDPSIVRVRLAFVDAPESKQSYGKEAGASLTAKLGGKGAKVTVFVTDKDQYGRTVGLIFNSDGLDVNYLQVAEGNAWLYQQYLNGKEVPRELKAAYQEAFLRAQHGKVGLWGHHASETPDGRPLNPREFRKANPRGSF